MDQLAFEFILQHDHHPVGRELEENGVEQTFPGKSGLCGVTSVPNAKTTWTGRNTLSVALGPVRRTWTFHSFDCGSLSTRRTSDEVHTLSSNAET